MDLNTFGRNVVEIASLLIGVALIGLLVGNAQGTATVINAAGATFNNLLRTVQSPGSGGGFNNFALPQLQ